MAENKKIYVFGDSHSMALQGAQAKGISRSRRIEVHRFQRVKSGVTIGDLTFEDCIGDLGRLTADDLVFSCIGGNQHQILGLIQHAVPFDFRMPDDTGELAEGAAAIPYSVLWDIFEKSVQDQDVSRLARLREATAARFFHLAPPPPKQDEAHIRRKHETAFVKNGLLKHGVSPASLRLKIWNIQVAVLRKLLTEQNISLVMPPSQALTEEGFLAPDYYADDATHANNAYGALLLQQIEDLANNDSEGTNDGKEGVDGDEAPKVLVIGNSHTYALEVAKKELEADDAADLSGVDFDINWVFSRDSKRSAGDGEIKDDLDVKGAFDRVATLDGKRDIVVLTVSGAFHNIVGFLQHSQPFEIAPLSGAINGTTTTIPTTAMEDHIAELTREKRNVLKFKQSTDARVYHLATPPPKADEEYIQSVMRNYRGTDISKVGLSPPALRLKLWETEMNVLRQVCAEWGVGFVEAPPAGRTPEGFLRREFYGPDATHANAAYGKLVLEQLRRLVRNDSKARKGS